MKKIILIILLLSAKAAFGQLINGGFEVWDTTNTAYYDSILIKEFGVPNAVPGKVNHWGGAQSSYGITQTTDAYSGKYALIIHNWYNYVTQTVDYNDTLSSRPTYLQGFYKYIKGVPFHTAQGQAKLILTRFNGSSNDTIGTGIYQFDSAAAYTPFQLTIKYISLMKPDSIFISIVNADKNSFAGGSNENNLLFLDDLSLNYSPTGIEDLNTNYNNIAVYPNPVENELNIQNNSNESYKFSIYNYLGEKIIDKNLTDKTNILNLSEFSSGIYFYKATSDNNIIQCGKIIKE